MIELTAGKPFTLSYPSPSGDWVYSEWIIRELHTHRLRKYPSPSGDWVYSESYLCTPHICRFSAIFRASNPHM